MHPAIRTQSDELGDIVSLDTGLDASASATNRDMARQEFKQEADINVQLAKFGVFAPQRQLYFGDVDYGLELQEALAAIADAKTAWRQMPDEIQKRYRTWQSLLNALETGEIKLNEGAAPIVTEPLQTGAPEGAQST